ncbi:MAG: transposase [Candidatus Peribacteria bacterium]|jgi:REP element-mobilizing transposase RayT|nr:transposase [Candidatus Peribacteria bacterium]
MQYLADIIQKDTLQVQEYIICRNHLHLIIQCENSKRDNIVRKLKGKTTQLYKKHHHITTPFHLRAQKYDAKVIHNEKYLHNALKYVKYNRLKH